ncbi:serologically defined colon cancer antigen 8 isoform X4 [Oryctolagus cuniculus]|uniref:serologically defined colon cancer antigen 8 isoform X4 n=1 Tax=Oryctolagus cuniculus TaxID=9986 RepID=UPI0022319003|nr:serologically defined colon cancer antigen 8 isoform X4 [Oryctolagus cuniculus]
MSITRARGWEETPRAASVVPGSPVTVAAGGGRALGLLLEGRTLDDNPRNSHLLAQSLCMAKSPGNSSLEEILGKYQRSLRERASRSIQQLKCVLKESDGAIGEDALDPAPSISAGNEGTEAALHELQHCHAVIQLKALLHQQESKESEASSLRKQKMSPLRSSEYEETSIPTVQNLVPIINDQSQYIHHLEAEVKFCKEELSGMKNRIEVVVLENERLLQEMQSQRQEETMREQTFLDASVRPKLNYEEKYEILESELKSLRKDYAGFQKKYEDLKEQLKHKESLLAANLSNRVGGLCLKCAQHEAVLSQTHNNIHMETIERLTKERDDLMSALVSVRSSLADVQQREASAYEQVKQAVQMTEEANFEKTKALIRCEQLKNELQRQTDRLEKELASQQEKRALEKERMKKEITKERQDWESKVCGEMRFQMNKTKMERDEAEKEHIKYKAKVKMDLEIKDQEIEKLRIELSENEQHLEQEQQKAARAREECLKLTELLGESEHQLHLTRLEKGSIQQSFSNEAKAQALQALQREQELTQKIQQMEAQHDKTENEQYSLMTSQNTFLTKLMEEFRTLVKKMDQISKKSRSTKAQLIQEKRYIYDKLEKLQRRNDELEEQCVQHGTVHERMKQRLRQLDRHGQATAQLVQLLKKQNQLLLERQSLSEVERLRTQLPSMPQSDC